MIGAVDGQTPCSWLRGVIGSGSISSGPRLFRLLVSGTSTEAPSIFSTILVKSTCALGLPLAHQSKESWNTYEVPKLLNNTHAKLWNINIIWLQGSAKHTVDLQGATPDCEVHIYPKTHLCKEQLGCCFPSNLQTRRCPTNCWLLSPTLSKGTLGTKHCK